MLGQPTPARLTRHSRDLSRLKGGYTLDHYDFLLMKSTID